MSSRHYLDPFNEYIPALERNVLRLRFLEVTLVLFYVERIKTKVLDLVQANDRWRVRFGTLEKERVPKGSKNSLKECFLALVDDGVISVEEKDEIVELINYRNIVGHEIHNIMFDVAPIKSDRLYMDIIDNYGGKYDCNAIERAEYYLKEISRRGVERHYVGTIRTEGIRFSPVERVIRDDIRRLRWKIDRGIERRKKELEDLNAELDIWQVSKFEGDPEFPENKQHNSNRLSKRGVDVCWRFFDEGRSALAVAHLMGISLTSARRHEKKWKEQGGSLRSSLPEGPV